MLSNNVTVLIQTIANGLCFLALETKRSQHTSKLDDHVRRMNSQCLAWHSRPSQSGSNLPLYCGPVVPDTNLRLI